MMDRVSLNDNLSISRLVYGMWRLCDDNDKSYQRVIQKLETLLGEPLEIGMKNGTKM